MPTFGGRVSPGERLRRLSAHECKAWLCSHHEGRLGYQSGRGHRSVVVSYAIADDQILVRLPDYNDIVPDHINPRGMAGAWRDDHPDNIQAVHWWCNGEKGSIRA